VVTFVPQDPFASFNPLFRIGTQIRDLMRHKAPSGAAGCSRKGDEAAAIAMLDAVQLPQPRAILAKYPHQLSGGQRQRVMIAMALLPQPRLIIADEPTTALDVTVQAQILGLLRRLAVERGVSVLFTTHDLGAAWEICDRIVVMYAGQTAEIAPREGFFADPRHPYTRMLLDSLPAPGRDPVGIPGGVPSPLKAPDGCRFNPRCPRATGICQESRPSLEGGPDGHLVACHHPWGAGAEAAHG
jgi:peptide/nickel transport system ATP-binding protein/oligopeptide transport system ATP-binding protein